MIKPKTRYIILENAEEIAHKIKNGWLYVDIYQWLKAEKSFIGTMTNFRYHVLSGKYPIINEAIKNKKNK